MQLGSIQLQNSHLPNQFHKSHRSGKVQTAPFGGIYPPNPHFGDLWQLNWTGRRKNLDRSRRTLLPRSSRSCFTSSLPFFPWENGITPDPAHPISARKALPARLGQRCPVPGAPFGMGTGAGLCCCCCCPGGAQEQLCQMFQTRSKSPENRRVSGFGSALGHRAKFIK